ncbi:DNA primase [Kushneria marisflavi]|uniref:DNA primase n=1 Tax=Kushneria marisflavi TaxID=157779 RepID=A0A240UKW9_9GAMM|nr:DNA primase [Kushneria marisflavi]ART62144.1 DNA primase [Kushneria marisflavi]RKD87224.1 DNA primase [Kushneria marisflavi]
MAGRIPQRFIDDLLARTDIVDVIGARVQLKKTGRNHSALCPFHQEKSPSFTVSADKQFYHCFGCGASGNALRFVMEFDRLNFPEAIEALAGRAGMEVPREGESDEQRQQARVQARRQEEAVNLLELGTRFYQQQLASGASQSAHDYLKRRGLSDDIVSRYAIGYAPAGWDVLKRHLSEKGVDENVQIEYGLLVRKEETGRSWDRFRDRVIFPIRDWKGRTIGFGGRVLGDEKPKYLNSPESPVFHKGRELYGLYETRMQSKRPERMLIVEGYMDVVALAQHGVDYAVATLGTATTEEHLRRLFRLVDEVVFCFDGDTAGRQAAYRALNTVLPQMIDGRQARFLFLPEGEDPDSLIRQEGGKAFEQRIVRAGSLTEYLFDHAGEGRDLRRLEDRERFASAVLEGIAKLPQGLLKSLLMRELSERTGLERSTLEEISEGRARPGVAASQTPQPQQHASSHESGHSAPLARKAPPRRQQGATSLSMSGRILHLIVHSPVLVEALPEGEAWCPEDDDGQLLLEVVRLVRAGGYRSSQVLLAHFHGSSHGSRLLTLLQREPLIPAALRQREMEVLVAHFEQQRKRSSPERELEALQARERNGEKLTREEAGRLWQLICELKR